MINNPSKYTAWVKAEAERLGFMQCGISRAEFLEQEAPRLYNWLQESMHGQMHYMQNHFDMRLDPRLLVPGAKSVVSLALNYFPEQKQVEQSYKISKYAYAEDYHFVIKDKLKEFLCSLRDTIGDVQGRVFVDSAPVLDKAWAAKSGLGWIGKNSNLINKKSGSFFFLAELIIDLELEYDGIVSDHCGTCTRCIDACPTNAIEQPYIVNGSKCISYLTIELKDSISKQFSNQLEDWIFGCDICQDVCPWNRFSISHSEPRFVPNNQVLSYSKRQWEELTEDTFNEIFKKSALKRSKFSGLLRNMEFLNTGLKEF